MNFRPILKYLIWTGITIDYECLFQNPLLSGDWLMRVGDLDIDLDNMDNVLSAITTPTHVRFKL